MAHCDVHGIDYSGRLCPRCIADQHHEDVVDVLETATRNVAWKQANPGEYECPHCRYITLKRGATRCPTCRGEVALTYWENVTAKEKAAAARYTEWKRDSDRKMWAQKREGERKVRDAIRRSVTVGLVGISVIALGLVFGYSPVGQNAPWWWNFSMWLTMGAFSVYLGRRFEDCLRQGYIPTWIGIWVGFGCVIAAVASLFR